MPIHVTTSTTQSLSNKTFVDRVSTTGIVYSNGGNSNQWNSTYSNIQSNSASWNASITALSNNGNQFALNSDGTYNISNDTISTGTNSIQLYSGTSAGITWYNSSGGGPGVDFLSRAQASTGAVKFTFLNGAPPFLTTKEFILSSDGRFTFTDGTIQSTAFTGTAIDTGVRALTSNWQNTYTIVNSNSATNWSYQGTDIKALTSNWQNTYTGFAAQSARNASVYTTVNSNSATWSAPTASSITGTRLASNVVGSSLTDVGVLTSLTTSGLISSGYVGSADSSLIIAGSNTKGGAGYHDFLRVTNGAAGATNPNKYFRINSSGELEVINSAYNSIIYTIDNSGNTTVGGNLTIIGGKAGYSSARPSFRVYGAGTTTFLAPSSNGDGTLNSNNFATDYNQGGHLNASTGVFTVPYAGIYQINVVGRTSGYSGGISQLACISPSKGDKVFTFLEWGASSNMIHVGSSSTAYLTAGETLKLKVLTGFINFDQNDNWSVAYLG